MNLFTETEILIMVSIISFLLLIVIILSISEILYRRKNSRFLEKRLEKEENDDIYNKLDKFVMENESKNTILTLSSSDKEIEVNPLEETSSVLEISVNTEEVKPVEEIEELIMEIEPLNVIKIEDEGSKVLDSKEKAQIELLKIEEELENTKSLEDTITNLEAIEEENAIISYQELLSNTTSMDVVLSDDGDEPITIFEVFNMINKEDIKSQTDDGLKITDEVKSVPLSEAYNGDFVKTPYLSPISGIETENLNEIQLENTANLEKLEKEIRKTNEFLNILNELKKNLE